MAIFKRSQFHISQKPPGWVTAGWGMESYAGEDVTVEGALGVAAAYSCVTLLSGDIASLPLILFRRLERGKERAVDRPAYWLMHDAPNPEHTSFTFREIQTAHILSWGNFYGQLIWDQSGVVREVWPLRPDRMSVFRENGVKKYLYRTQSGSDRAFRADEIMHIPGFGFDGLVGYSPLELAINTLGLAVAAEKYGSRVFKNDARPSVVLMTKGVLDEDAYKRMRESWEQSYKSADNAGKTAILEEDTTLKEVGFPPEQAMFIESQKWSLLQLARIYHIPPHMIGAVEVSTSWGSGIEQQEQGYVNHTLRSLTRRMEQQLNRSILLERDRKDYFFEHLFDDLLRGDTTARYQAYNMGIQSGFITRNEVRIKENLNPLDGLDEPLVPLNMAGADEADGEMNDASPADDPNGEANDTVRAFVLDAAERMVRREVNEVTDAVKRYLDKDKPEKFRAWLEEFYKREQAEYIRRTFAPLKTDIDRQIGLYCLEHGQLLERAIEDQTILTVIERWHEDMPRRFADALKEIV